MFDLVIKNGLVFFEKSFVEADLAIEGEKIACIGKNLSGKNEIDAKGKWVLPGAIDAHTHFSLPFYDSIASDDFYTGSIAGAAGGVTTFIDFTAQENKEGLIPSINRRFEEAKPAAIDYSLHACIAQFTEEVADQIKLLPDLGIMSFKIFTAYNKIGRMQNDENLFRIMELCKLHNILVTVHAENGMVIDYLTNEAEKRNDLGITALRTTRPVFTESEAISRVCKFAKFTGCKAHIVHISSGEGAETLEDEKINGAPVSGETCPQYLYLDDSVFDKPNGHYWGCCPPVRPLGQQDRIWECLNNQSVAMVATDHCTFNKADKDTWGGSINRLPMGIPGIETMPELVLNGALNGKVEIATAIKSITENPSRIFGMYPEKGSLIPGTDADIMIFDQKAEQVITQKNLHMNNDYSVYEGLKIRGKNSITILRGKVIYDEYKGWLGEKGQGRFIKRTAPDSAFFD